MNQRRTLAYLILVASLMLVQLFGKRDSSSRSTNSTQSRAITQVEKTAPKKELAQATQSVAPKADALNSTTLNDWQRINRCYDHMVEEAHERCHGVCAVQAAEKAGSWIANWANDGWESPHQPLNPNQTTTPGKFYYSLNQAGLLEGHEALPQDDEAALQGLYEVHNEDPSNSAPLLFAAAIEFRRGNSDEARQILEEARRSTHFYDSYVLTIRNEFVHFTDADPVSNIQTWEVTSQAPAPNLLELTKTFETAHEDREIFARQMMREALESGGTNPEVQWNVLEYSIGYKWLKTKSPELVESLPTRRELYELNAPSSAEYDSINKDLEVNCNPEILRPSIERYRQMSSTVRDQRSDFRESPL